MSRFAVLVFYIFFLVGFQFCYALDAGQPIPKILVSVAPYKYLVERIAGKTVQVDLLVPAGASAHTFEPTPRQTISASKSQIWFRIGEYFEDRALKAFLHHNPKMQAVDLRQGVHLIANDPLTGCSCNRSWNQDLHIWLSTKELKIQAFTILKSLQRAYPEYEQEYQMSFSKLENELNALDKEISDLLSPKENRWMMVSHPAYAYFCRDYCFKQLSIEMEGRDPTPQQLNKIVQQAREYQIQTIFVQPQYSNKGAYLLSKEIGAKIVILDPYAENILRSLREIATEVAKS